MKNHHKNRKYQFFAILLLHLSKVQSQLNKEYQICFERSACRGSESTNGNTGTARKASKNCTGSATAHCGLA
jgi:hypothetical protein